MTLLALGTCCLVLGACADDDDATEATAETTTEATTEAASTVAPSTSATATTVPDVAEPALREELLAMMAEDQAVRTGVAPPGDDRTADELFADWDRVDAEHAARMTEILDTHGWPGWSLVGEDGSTAAWVLVQHADLTPELQRRALELLQQAVDAGDASPGDLAYLTDRVRVADGQPQVYGTQWETDTSGSLVPRTPIEEPAAVDERRAAAGLDTLDAYLDELRSAFEAAPTLPQPTGG